MDFSNHQWWVWEAHHPLMKWGTIYHHFIGLSHGIIRIVRPCLPVTWGSYSTQVIFVHNKAGHLVGGGTNGGGRGSIEKFGDPSSFRFWTIRMVFFTPETIWFFTIFHRRFTHIWYMLDMLVPSRWCFILGWELPAFLWPQCFMPYVKKAHEWGGAINSCTQSPRDWIPKNILYTVLWYGLTTPYIQMFLTLTLI